MIKDIKQKNENIDVVDEQLNRLKNIYPDCFNQNGDFDIEKFKENISKSTNIIKEGYGLSFLGKNYSKLIASLDTETIIVPDLEDNSNEENKKSENIYISGDNLDALKHLTKSYIEKIKCIYIDPPYNTGSDGFVYNDKFVFSIERLVDNLDISEEEAKRIFELTNSKSNSHSAWLTFMYPRLYLARQLLTNDGAIFISIGEDEVNNLKLLADNIFGEENFVTICPRKTRGSATTKSDAELQKLNDYVLVYLKDKENSSFKLKIEGQKEYPYEDDRGKYYTVPLQDNGPAGTRTARPNLYYPIYLTQNGSLNLERQNESDIEYLPDKHRNDDGRWMWSKEKFLKNNKDLCVSKEKVCIKHYFNKDEDQNKYMQERNWLDKFQNAKGTNDLNNLFEEKGLFSNPKPVELIEFLINLIADDDSIILDFFGGSGSTAEAVMNSNKKNGKRKFIIVQLPENLEDNLKLVGKEAIKQLTTQIDFLKSINKPLYLDEIGQERIRRAAKKIEKETKADIDYGFKHYTVKEVNTNTLDKLEKFNPNFMLSDRTILDEFGIDSILTTWMVSDGYGLTDKYEELDLNGYKGYKCENTIYLINPDLSDKAIKYLIEKYEKEDFDCNRIVLFGYSFALNEIQTLKDNLKQVKNIKNINVDVITRY